MTKELHKISVLYFSNSFVRGGAEEHILTLLRHLDRKRFQLSFMCPPECARQLGSDVPADVDLYPVSFQRPYHVRGAYQLHRLLKQKNIGILHSHLFGASLAASPIGCLAGVPVIIETPHVREGWRRGFIKGSYFVDRMMSNFVDHFIAVSAANSRYLIEDKKLPGNKVHVIYNGCDLQKFRPLRPLGSNLRASLGFSEQDPVLMTLGRLEPQKGHRYLLEAFAIVRREFPTARLVCIGEGSLRNELVETCRQLQMTDNVRFIGFQSNIPEWLAISDFTVLSSLYEGLPLVAIESLAAERPVVATRADGSAEIVINEETGLTVPPANVPELATAIARMLRDPQFRDRLARAGRQRVTDYFSQEQQIKKTQELYMLAWETLAIRRGRIRPAGDGTCVESAIQVQDN